MPGQGAAAADQLQGIRVVLRHRFGDALVHQPPPVHAVDARSALQRREGEPHGVLGQAIDGGHGLAAEAAGREAFAEAAQGPGMHGFGAVEGQPPAGEVQALDVLFREPGGAEFVGEVGRGGNAAAVAVDGGQPAPGPGDEGER